MTVLRPQTGAGFEMAAGQTLSVWAPQGEQVSDFFCVAADDISSRLSSGRSIDYASKVAFTVDDVLYSNDSQPMVTIVEDTCGRHDFLLTPCSQDTFDLLYPELQGAAHPSCLANLYAALSPYGVGLPDIGTTLNIFMDVQLEPDGTVRIDPPPCTPRDRFVLRAEMDLYCGLTACSAEKSNAGVCKPIAFELS